MVVFKCQIGDSGVEGMLSEACIEVAGGGKCGDSCEEVGQEGEICPGKEIIF